MPVRFNVPCGRIPIDWSDFHRRLRESVPIADVLTMLGVTLPSHRPWRGYHVRCPVHADKAPSLYVYVGDNRAFCFGACERGFDVIELYAAVTGVEYIDAADVLGEKFCISPLPGGVQDFSRILCTQHLEVKKERQPVGELPPPMSGDQARFYHRQLKDGQYAWLEEKRLLPRWLVDQVMIGHTPLKDWPPAYTIPVWGGYAGEDLLTIRFRRDDKLAEERGVCVTKQEREWVAMRKYWGIKKRNDVYPFGLWYLGAGGGYVALDESELNVLALHANGVPAMTLTMGASERRWPEWMWCVDPFERWLVTFDDDPAGRRAAAGMRLLWPHRVALFPWPDRPWGPGKDGGGDTTDFLRLFGFKEWLERAERAVQAAADPNHVAIGDASRRLWKGVSDMAEAAWLG